jgi:hypothetical protein
LPTVNTSAEFFVSIKMGLTDCAINDKESSKRAITVIYFFTTEKIMIRKYTRQRNRVLIKQAARRLPVHSIILT